MIVHLLFFIYYLKHEGSVHKCYFVRVRRRSPVICGFHYGLALVRWCAGHSIAFWQRARVGLDDGPRGTMAINGIRENAFGETNFRNNFQDAREGEMKTV